MHRGVVDVPPDLVEHWVDYLSPRCVFEWNRGEFVFRGSLVLVDDAALNHQGVTRDGVGLLLVTDLVTHRILVGGNPIIHLLVVVVVAIPIRVEVGLPIVLLIILSIGDLVYGAVAVGVELLLDLVIKLLLGLALQLFLKLGGLEVVGDRYHLDVEHTLGGYPGRPGGSYSDHVHTLLQVLVRLLGKGGLGRRTVTPLDGDGDGTQRVLCFGFDAKFTSQIEVDTALGGWIGGYC